MVKKVLSIPITVTLVLLPFLPIPAKIVSTESRISDKDFSEYILACFGVIAVALVMVFFSKPKRQVTAWLLFSVGMVSILPLHLGPPRTDVELLNFASIEKFRFAMLTLAVILMFLGSLSIALPIRTGPAKFVAGLLGITVLLNVWDNYSSLTFGAQIQHWVESGNKAEDFFPQFDFQIFWRTLARELLYVSVVLMSLILFQEGRLRKWQLISLTAFSSIGILFGILHYFTREPAFYLFMIPAIALAPTYWLGLALLFNREIRTPVHEEARHATVEILSPSE